MARREKGTTATSVLVSFLSLIEERVYCGLIVSGSSGGKHGSRQAWQAGSSSKSSHLDPQACGRVRVIGGLTLGMAWAAETSNPSDTAPPGPQLLFLPKQCHQLRTSI
jgi:hypothetical protein